MYKIFKDMEFLFETVPSKIKYFYHTWQNLYKQMEDMLGNRISFQQGCPTEENIDIFLQNADPPSVIVLDDLSRAFLNDQLSERLYCISSHHARCYIFCLQHSAFYKANFSRIVSLNSKIFIFLTNYRNADQIKKFSHQTQMGQALVESYLDCINHSSYGYLICDLSQDCPSDLRLRSQIFKDENLIIYVPATSKTSHQLIPKDLF
jgi:hypothetical protein